MYSLPIVFEIFIKCLKKCNNLNENSGLVSTSLCDCNDHLNDKWNLAKIKHLKSKSLIRIFLKRIFFVSSLLYIVKNSLKRLQLWDFTVFRINYLLWLFLLILIEKFIVISLTYPVSPNPWRKISWKKIISSNKNKIIYEFHLKFNKKKYKKNFQ